jgi:hypothetical protein
VYRLKRKDNPFLTNVIFDLMDCLKGVLTLIFKDCVMVSIVDGIPNFDWSVIKPAMVDVCGMW